MNDNHFVIHNEDCLRVMSQLDEDSIDVIVSDPPYGVNYASDRTTYDDGKEKITQLIPKWLNEWYRILKSQSWIFLFTGVKNINVWINEAEQVGFTFKNLLATRSFSNGSMVANNFAFVMQPVLVFTKGKGRKFNYVDFFPTSKEWLVDKRNKNPKPYSYQYPNFIPSNICYGTEVFGGGNKSSQYHPNAKNEDLCRFFIEIASNPGDVVFDPFTGCGTTGAAALSVGRNFLGCEIDPHWANIAHSRCEGNQHWRHTPQSSFPSHSPTQLELPL